MLLLLLVDNSIITITFILITVVPGYNHTAYKHKHDISTLFPVTKSFALQSPWV